MRDPGVPRPQVKDQASRDTSPQKPKLEPVELAVWFERHADHIADRWLSEVRTRQPRWVSAHHSFLDRFFRLLAKMLPAGFGPYRDQIEPLWVQTAELFGSVAARRGLAAGEAVDEFQLLREVVIRELYGDPPAAGIPLSLRDLLTLNRMIDRAVAQASIGHADALFFALFRGSGVPESLDEDVTREVTEQLDGIDEEFRATMRLLRG